MIGRALIMEPPDYRQRLIKFYTKHNPERLPDVDRILFSFRGSEEELFEQLRAKYPEEEEAQEALPATPPPPSSTPPAAPVITPPSEPDVDLPEAGGRRRTKSLIEVTEPMLQRTHNDLLLMGRDLVAIDPLAIQRMMAKFAALALDNRAGGDDDNDELDSLRGELHTIQTTVVGLVTRLQLSVQNFLNTAERLVGSAAELSTEVQSAGESVDLWRGRTADPPPPKFAVTEFDLHYHNMYGSKENRPRGGAPGGGGTQGEAASSSSLQQGADGAVTAATKLVFDIFPTAEGNVIADVALNKAAPGDVIVLHPGEYFENLVVRSDIEIRAAFDSDATAVLDDKVKAGSVVIYPCDPTAPTLQVIGDGRCRLNGLMFRKARDNVKGVSVPTGYVPLLSCSGTASLALREVCVHSGGGGIVCLGQSELTLTMCTFRRCTFSGVYLKDSSFASITDSSFVDCDVAIRVRDATFSIDGVEARDSTKDAVVCHGSARGIIAKSRIEKAAENGVLLSPSSEVVINACVIAKCGKYGVYAPNGAEFAVVGTTFGSNALGDTSRAAPLQSALLSKHNLAQQC